MKVNQIVNKDSNILDKLCLISRAVKYGMKIKSMRLIRLDLCVISVGLRSFIKWNRSSEPEAYRLLYNFVFSWKLLLAVMSIDAKCRYVLIDTIEIHSAYSVNCLYYNTKEANSIWELLQEIGFYINKTKVRKLVTVRHLLVCEHSWNTVITYVT